LRVDYADAKIEVIVGSDAALTLEPRLRSVADACPDDGSIRARELTAKLECELEVGPTVAKALIKEACAAGFIRRVSRGEYSRVHEDQSSVGRSDSVN
jgi:hypothetical protein